MAFFVGWPIAGLLWPVDPIRHVRKQPLMGFQATGSEHCNQLLHGCAWRRPVELAIQPEPDLAVVHCRLEAQMHKTAGTSGSIDRLLQVQAASRIIGHEMLDIPDELASVARLDQRTVVSRWWR